MNDLIFVLKILVSALCMMFAFTFIILTINFSEESETRNDDRIDIYEIGLLKSKRNTMFFLSISLFVLALLFYNTISICITAFILFIATLIFAIIIQKKLKKKI